MEPIVIQKHIEVPESLSKLSRVLYFDHGCNNVLVGGAVRDSLLGLKPKDYDLATNWTPERIMLVLKKYHPEYHVIEVGKQFGVITVVTPEKDEYEIATFRKDSATNDGRRPDAVEFTTMEFDANRRDLTINALYYNLIEHEIYDFVGGVRDLELGLVRTVGAPAERFGEDRLRIMRALRFAARMGFKLDQSTSVAIKNNPSLVGVSHERVRDEFVKGLATSEEPATFINLLHEHGLMKEVFPGMTVGQRRIYNTRQVPLMLFQLLRPDNPRHLVEKLLNKLTYTKEEVALTSFLFELFLLDEAKAVKLRRKADSLKVNTELLETLKSIMDFGYMQPMMNFKLFTPLVNFKLTVTGEELMKEGFKEGKELGIEMERREQERFKAFAKLV